MISAKNLTKHYQGRNGSVNAVQGLDLEIKNGEFVMVHGASGCGKSTMLMMLGGMLQPDDGVVDFGERDLYAMSRRVRATIRNGEIGFVFQMFHLVPYLTVQENMELVSPLRDSAEKQARSNELLETLGLVDRMAHKPSELSAGERQRTALGRALFNHPKVILADEPTGNLDEGNTAEVYKTLNEFKQKGGTVLVVSHGTEGDSLADQILTMKKGRLD